MNRLFDIQDPDERPLKLRVDRDDAERLLRTAENEEGSKTEVTFRVDPDLLREHVLETFPELEE